MKKPYLFLPLLLAFSTGLAAQKVEIEKKVREEAFPAPALDLLDRDFSGRKCERYYLESDGDTTNFEAKFKWEGSRYSVEFNNDGVLQDIEKQIGFDQLPGETQGRIEDQFGRDFAKYKVKKVQVQTLPAQLDIRYEIEVKGKNKEDSAFFEYLFSERGDLLQRRKILLPPNDITLY